MKKEIRKTITPLTIAFVVAIALIFVPQTDPAHADRVISKEYKNIL